MDITSMISGSLLGAILSFIILKILEKNNAAKFIEEAKKKSNNIIKNKASFL